MRGRAVRVEPPLTTRAVHMYVLYYYLYTPTCSMYIHSHVSKPYARDAQCTVLHVGTVLGTVLSFGLGLLLAY